MTRIEVRRGDITAEDCDAIVNAAQRSLLGGGGVDGAIHRAGGEAVLAACRALRATTHPDGLPAGEAVATVAGDLRASWVIHTVGPQRWAHPDGGADLLASCHSSSLDVAHSLGVRTVAFPAVSCGAYGWSADDAAPVAVGAVRDWFAHNPVTTIEAVRFVLFNDEAHLAFARQT